LTLIGTLRTMFFACASSTSLLVVVAMVIVQCHHLTTFFFSALILWTWALMPFILDGFLYQECLDTHHLWMSWRWLLWPATWAFNVADLSLYLWSHLVVLVLPGVFVITLRDERSRLSLLMVASVGSLLAALLTSAKLYVASPLCQAVDSSPIADWSRPRLWLSLWRVL